MTSKCHDAVLERLDDLGMTYVKTPGPSPVYQILSGSRKGVDWRSKKIHIRCSSLKNDFRPKSILSYGWIAQDWSSPIDYDFLICGACPGGDVSRIFVFEAKDTVTLPDVHLSRYRGIRKRIHLFQSISDLEAAKIDLKIRQEGGRGKISPWEEKINQVISSGSEFFDL